MIRQMPRVLKAIASWTCSSGLGGWSSVALSSALGPCISVCWALLACFANSLFEAPAAAEEKRPRVPAYDRFYEVHAGERLDQRSLERAGRLLLSELGCVACHKATAEASRWIDAKQAPRLDRISAIQHPAHWKSWLSSTPVGATMPDVLHSLSGAEREKTIEAIVSYLASFSPGAPGDLASIGAKRRGGDLYSTIGCAVCHGERNALGPTAGAAPSWRPLTGLDEKYTYTGLAQFLLDPLHFRPAGRMPSLRLTEKEASDLAAFLLPTAQERTGIAYAYYEGDWSSLPDFESLTPTETGATEAIDVAPRRRDDQFALRFEGVLKIEQAGEYAFHLGSDDGSRLSIDSSVVIEQNRIQGFTWTSAKRRLEAGAHHIQVDYFEQAGEQQLELEWQGPDLPRKKLAADLLALNDVRPEMAVRQVDSSLVDKGRRLFAASGCASCHVVDDQVGGSPAAPPPDLASLNPQRGCLADQPGPRAAVYSLSPTQKEALAAVIRFLAHPPEPERSELIEMGMESRFCYACHERSGKGGPVAAQNGFFVTLQPEMGDEGRLPPALNGVGGKLTKEWLDRTLTEGLKDRPYMLTRMPAFGGELAKSIGPLLEEEDRLPPLERIAIEPATARSAGWKLVGDEGFGCIKCHTFGRFRATGVQSIDMTIMHRRLRPEWFFRYVDDPQAFRRGTRMPDAWPSSDGLSLIKSVLDGTNQSQIQAVWDYLADGPRARTPVGLAGQTLELVPTAEAVVYRNFLEGAGARAIGVGYPEHLNLAFDASDLRLALLWHGAFVDASLHWTGRGAGFQRPAGDNAVSLPAGPDFAQLADADSPWPRRVAGGSQRASRFRGYRLTGDQRPTFLYDCGPARIEDFPNPAIVDDELRMTRTFRIHSDTPLKGVWFRVAEGGSISEPKDGWRIVDGKLRIRLQGADAKVRSSGGRQEWIAPLPDASQAAIVVEYAW